jgi:hypothetical protein
MSKRARLVPNQRYSVLITEHQEDVDASTYDILVSETCTPQDGQLYLNSRERWRALKRAKQHEGVAFMVEDKT